LEKHTSNSPTRFGYELLRDHLLPSILGKHEDDILYWAGKELARKFPMFTTDELFDFFKEAGWGSLTVDRTGKDEIFYVLTSDYNSSVQNRSCQLEAGFLAEQTQKLTNFLTECHGETSDDGSSMKFQVKWDSKTPR
jgi:predicted hydrocarbon binding protein